MRRIPIAEEQRIVIRLVEQARAVDRGYRALLLRADVHQLDGGAALEQGLQIGRRQLPNRRSVARHDRQRFVTAQGLGGWRSLARYPRSMFDSE